MELYATDVRASYFAPLDILYVVLGDHSLDCCYTIEDTPSGITVMYDEDMRPTGVEIYGLAKHTKSLPADIYIDAETPFALTVAEADGYPSKALATA